jgi:hypothetical protein
MLEQWRADNFSATSKCKPEVMLLFSSLASLFGNTGQITYTVANHMLAQLAQHWKTFSSSNESINFPVRCVDLPIVVGAGRLSYATAVEELYKNIEAGFNVVSSKDLCACFEQLCWDIRSPTAHTIIDVPKFAAYVSESQNSLMFDHFAPFYKKTGHGWGRRE